MNRQYKYCRVFGPSLSWIFSQNRHTIFKNSLNFLFNNKVPIFILKFFDICTFVQRKNSHLDREKTCLKTNSFAFSKYKNLNSIRLDWNVIFFVFHSTVKKNHQNNSNSFQKSNKSNIFFKHEIKKLFSIKTFRIPYCGSSKFKIRRKIDHGDN